MKDCRLICVLFFFVYHCCSATSRLQINLIGTLVSKTAKENSLARIIRTMQAWHGIFGIIYEEKLSFNKLSQDKAVLQLKR